MLLSRLSLRTGFPYLRGINSSDSLISDQSRLDLRLGVCSLETLFSLKLLAKEAKSFSIRRKHSLKLLIIEAKPFPQGDVVVELEFA